MVRSLSEKKVRGWLPKRRLDSHKGSFGHVFILAGSKQMPGAARLCVEGALRGGAGLVTLGYVHSLHPVLVRALRPEALTVELPQSTKGTLSQSAWKVVRKEIFKRRVTSVVLGPGISTHSSTRAFVKECLSGLKVPLVLDADGLNALSQFHRVRSRGGKSSFIRAKCVLTPHPGEAARLLGVSSKRIQSSRESSAIKLWQMFGGVVVLKGHRTIVTDGQNIFVNRTGNPGMATGGSGDVLAGLIGALIGQIKEVKLAIESRLFQAACVGVTLHGLAGDLAAKEKTQMCLVAGDLAEFLPKAVKKMSRTRTQ